MKLVLAALSLFCLLGMSKLQAGPLVPAAAAPPAEESAVGNGEEEAYCPMQWTCNFRNWYTSQAACQAGCVGGFGCQLEYHCMAGCVCP